MNLGLGNTIPINSVRQGLGGGGGGGGFDNTYSLAFDGVDDYVDTGISTLTGTDFSISYWFKTTATLTNFNYYVPFSAVTNQQFVGAYLYYHPTTKLTFRSRNSSGTLVKGTVDLSDGNWHNIVVTYDSTSYALKMYVDGSIDYDETIYSYAVFNQPLLLGGKSSSLNLIDCSIDEASLFNSVLTSENVTSIYNSGVPNDISSISGLTAWYRNGDNGSYKSPQWLIPNNSNKDKVSNYSFSFDGVDDYVSMGNPTDLQITGELTLSCWVKITGSTGSNQGFIYKDAAGVARAYKLQLTSSTNKATLTIFNSGSAFHTHSTSTINDGNWHNIVAVYTPSTSVVIYVDGVAETTNTSSVPASIDNRTAPFELGRRGDGAFPLNGNLDSVSVFNTALTQENVTAIYNSGTITTLPVTPISHWKMADNSTFSTNWTVPDAVGSNNGTSANMTIEDRVGEASSSTSNAVSFNMTESDRETDVPT